MCIKHAAHYRGIIRERPIFLIWVGVRSCLAMTCERFVDKNRTEIVRLNGRSFDADSRNFVDVILHLIHPFSGMKNTAIADDVSCQGTKRFR